MKKSYKLFMLGLLALVLIPAKAEELLNYPLDTINGEEVYRYVVERGIGLYRIGVNFDVSQNDIIRLNPQLRERGLHCDELIYVPTKRKVGAKVQVIESAPVVIDTKITETTVVPDIPKKQEPTPQPVVTQKTEPQPIVETIVETKVVTDSAVRSGKLIELAIMLPFESQQSKRSGNADRMIEFYQGVLLGLRDLQSDSVRYRVRVYDTERSERRVDALTETNELDSVQAILGLAYPLQIERMASWCHAHNVPLLLPFSNETDVATTPNVLQFNSSDEQQADSLCSWMAKRDAKFVALEVQDGELAESVRILRKQMKAHKISYSALALRDLMNDTAAYALSKGKENVLILHSDKYQHVRIVLPHIEKLRKAGYNIRIVSQYSWQKEGVGLPQVYTSMFTAGRDHSTFDARWSNHVAGDHVSVTPRYDILGYDLIHALVDWLNGKKESHGLESDIIWQRVGAGGWQNANVKVVEK